MSPATIKIVSKGPPRVFVSYSSKNEDVAAAVCAAIESRGIRCWIAPRDIPCGKDWAEEIMNGIECCRIMIIVWSSHSNRSRPVMNEVERAVNKGLLIIPFRIEQLQPSKSFEFFFSLTQWLDAITPPIQKHINKLVEQVIILLNADHAGYQSSRTERLPPLEEQRGPVPIITRDIEFPPDEWDKPKGKKRSLFKSLLDD